MEIRQQWHPLPNIPTLEWLPEHIYLPAEDSDSPGRYNGDLVPYFWGVMHALDRPEAWLVCLQKAAQIGWTVLLAAWVCKTIVTDPSRILGLFPKDEKSRNFIDEKFTPMIEASPTMRRYVDVSTSRKSGNRSTLKKFTGGELKVVGSNSVSNVKSTSARRGIVEEPDDTNRDVGDQGDAIRLFRERLKRMRNKKLIIGGTPSVDGLSQVQHYTRLGTQRELPIRCHDCSQMHVLDWDNVSWQQKQAGTAHPVFGLHQPDTAVYVCPHCGSMWDDHRRKRNILETCRAAQDDGDPFAGWVKTQCGDGFSWDEIEPIETFQELSELYVCIPGTSLADVVRDYLEAEHEAELGDEAARIVFQNSKLGRPYQFAANQVLDHEKLREAAEDYEPHTCPSEGLLVTVGVDVQHDRLAVIIRAFGRREESWLMHWGEIDGDPLDKSDPCWTALDALVFQQFKHERFGDIGASAISIDSSDGGSNNAVYHWVRTRTRRYRGVEIMAIKGSSHDYGDREIFTRSRPVDFTSTRRQTKADRYGVHAHPVGTHTAKDLISKRLLGSSAYMHSCKHVRADYWEQVTAEVKAPSKRHRGRLLWQERPGRRNEALDCEVYALHAAYAKGMHKWTDAKWSELEARLSQRTLFTPAKAPLPEPDEPRKPRQPSRPIGSLI